MRPLLLGHRGHREPRWNEAENTLAAFERALAQGCDGFELDLHCTADGRIVVHHDAAVRVDSEAVAIAEASLRTLRRLRPEMATLDQVLRRFRQRAWMDLEIKTEAAVDGTAEELKRRRPQAGCVVSSFEPEVLGRMAKLEAGLPLCLNLRRPCSLRRLAGLRARTGLSWVAPHVAGCTAWYVRRLRAAGWRVLVWTVNRPAKMRLLARAGVDAIVSDDPGRLREILGSKQTR